MLKILNTMNYLSTFEQEEKEITKEQAQKIEAGIAAFNSAMIDNGIPVILKLDDAHNTKRFFVYTDWINTEPSIVDREGNRVFNGDICSAHGYYFETPIFAEKQQINIWRDEKGLIHSTLFATGGSTGNEPDDGPSFEDDYEFEDEEITLIENK